MTGRRELGFDPVAEKSPPPGASHKTGPIAVFLAWFGPLSTAVGLVIGASIWFGRSTNDALLLEKRVATLEDKGAPVAQKALEVAVSVKTDADKAKERLDRLERIILRIDKRVALMACKADPRECRSPGADGDE